MESTLRLMKSFSSRILSVPVAHLVQEVKLSDDFPLIDRRNSFFFLRSFKDGRKRNQKLFLHSKHDNVRFTIPRSETSTYSQLFLGESNR